MKIKNLIAKRTEDEIRERIKNVCLGLLDKFAKVCKDYNLKWWLDGGTLLGAVRNGKIIPWDDDIDVTMPRDDYDELCQLALTDSNLFGTYFFQTGHVDNCFEVHAKLRDPNTCALTEREFGGTHHRGMFLDIFPLDNAPNDLHIRKDIAGFVRTIAKHTGQEQKFENSSKYFNMLNDVLRTIGNRYEHSGFIANMTFWRYDKNLRILKKSNYERTQTIIFEDRPCPIPSGYEQVLKSWYGTSWKIPTQVPNCHKAFVDPFNSYKHYNGCTKEDFDRLING